MVYVLRRDALERHVLALIAGGRTDEHGSLVSLEASLDRFDAWLVSKPEPKTPVDLKQHELHQRLGVA